MLKHLHRWHFDLALFLGLAIFSWAYWYTKPRPLWTTYYNTESYDVKYSFKLLGYSADCQSIYTACDSKKLSKVWPVPQIQRWSTLTGELLEDDTLEMPEEDRFQLQLPRPHQLTPYSVTLCDDPSYIMVRYEQSKLKDHHYIRLYRINGKPVGQGLEVPRYYRVEYLTDLSKGDRHWAVSFELNPKNTELPISVIDLNTGKTVRPPQTYARGKLDAFPRIAGGRYLYFVMKPTETKPMEIEIVDLQTGESQGRVQTTRFPGYFLLDDSHFAVCVMIGDVNNYTTRLDFYCYDAIAKAIVPDHSHPLDGITSVPMQWFTVKPPYLLSETRNTVNRKESEVIKTVLGWFARIGIVRSDSNSTILRVADLTTGQPLRQISGVPPHDDSKPAPDWRSIVAITRNDKGEPGLCLYLIPHYLWETSLSWMQWLSWLLVIPWPLRYFVQPHLTGGCIKTSPTH